MRRILAALCLVATVVTAVLWLSYSPAAPAYQGSTVPLPARLRTWAEHDRILREHGNPYVLRFRHLVFFGVRHTSDRHDPQLVEIERLWTEFRPTVALYEGRQRRYFVGPLFRFGSVTESRLVHQLARRDGVQLVSLEPRYEDEVAALLRRWSAEQVALFFFTRVYWSEAGGEANDRLARDLLAKRTDVDGLRESLPDVAAVDTLWQRDFTERGDWRTLNEEPKGTYLGQIADDSRTVRGEHMARTLIDLTRRGERVFAVVGSGHVIRLEPILSRLLGTFLSVRPESDRYTWPIRS
jgi:hypothetical protein